VAKWQSQKHFTTPVPSHGPTQGWNESSIHGWRTAVINAQRRGQGTCLSCGTYPVGVYCLMDTE
jgi:hypothetical protein